MNLTVRIVILQLNTARDLGGRFAAGVIWGRGAFPADYTALAALTNIAASICGAAFQFFILADSTRPAIHRKFVFCFIFESSGH